MRNFYKHLALAPNASQEEIEGKLDTLKDAKLKEAARYVLLDPKRKRVYDRNHKELIRIGKLRYELKLIGSSHWPAGDHGNYRDFTPMVGPRNTFLRGIVVAGSCILLVALRLWWITLILIIVAISSTCGRISAYSSARKLSEYYRAHPALWPPETGVLRWYSQYYGKAPFEVRTPYQGPHYFIKLEDANTGQVVLTGFIQSSQTLKTKVPIGRYKLKYATGSTWFGEQELFGPETSYNIADKVMDFRETYNGYEGHTVELILQRNGNLQTRNIPPSSF